MEKGEKQQFLFFSTIFYNLILDFCVITRTRFFLRDKRLFEITEVEITRIECICKTKLHMTSHKLTLKCVWYTCMPLSGTRTQKFANEMLFGCFGPLRQYFSLYRRGRKKTRTYYKRYRPLPYYHPNCRTPRHWKFTQNSLVAKWRFWVQPKKIVRTKCFCINVFSNMSVHGNWMMPPWHHWGNWNIQDGVQDGRQRIKSSIFS